MRENVHLSGSTTIVLLYEDEKFFVRLLRRGTKPTFLTKKCEVSPEDMKNFAGALNQVRNMTKWTAEHHVNWGDVILIAQGDKIIAGMKGSDVALGFGDSILLSGALTKILFEVLGEIA